MSAPERERGRRALSEDERALWHGITRSIKPLKRRRVKAEPADAEPPAGRRPKSPPARPSQPTALRPAPKPKPVLPLTTLDRRTRARLARGNEPIERRLDLHGRSQSEAHAVLLRALQSAQADGIKTVLVITGKGAPAGEAASERGVLKRQVPLWLGLPEFRAYVLGIEQAHIAHGGSGALYVRVRRARLR
jgi:DNA-nicking Smr family endonuclease